MHFFVVVCIIILNINLAHSASSEKKPFTNEPDVLKPVYHYPNEYELESYKFWKENKAFPHYHGHQPSGGRLHQHYQKYGVDQYNYFITDPPGIGLNAQNGGNNGDDGSDDIPHHGHGKNIAKGTKSQRTIVDIDIDDTFLRYLNGSEKELVNESNTGDPLVSEFQPSVGAIDTAHIGVEPSNPNNGDFYDVGRNAGPKPIKLSCCSCCNQIPKLNIIPQSNFNYNSGGGCGGGVGYYNNYGSYGCGQQPAPCCLRLPTCCLPQLPCCPRIEIPCCPVQPICCQPSRPCGPCRSAKERALRTKRFGCIPCAGRKKRSIELSDEPTIHNDVANIIHIRQKRLGCVPCLRKRAKRQEPVSSSLSSCQKCTPFGSYLVNRFKRQTNCVQCKRTTSSALPQWTFLNNVVSHHLMKRSVSDGKCDKSCCDYSKCPIIH